jgi:GTP-binding protein
MAILDETNLNISAGRGGDGVVRWRRESGIPMGGPWGGDGGKGGDVYVVGQRNLHTLHDYRHQKDFHAQDGAQGGTKLMAGVGGEDMVLKFPLGTILTIREIDKQVELLEENGQILLFRGGQGGYGNAHFKSSTNQAPEEWTPGRSGEYGTVHVELRMIADIGLVGFPNAGKSSLLNTLTKAQSKVGNYNFTTLEPHLGDYHGYIIADIPGLIEGASEGKGLGHRFLKHVQRTKMIVHMIEATSGDYLHDYEVIRGELQNFNDELLHKNEIVVISKLDNLDLSDKDVRKDFEKRVKAFEKKIKKEVVLLSLFDEESVKGFEKVLMKNLI